MTKTYRGSCHCQAVQFEVTGVPEEFTTCDCSLCVKKNALMWNVPSEQLKVVAGTNKLSLYQWNTRVAKHYFCKVCGIYTFHRKRAAPDYFGVNVYCLEELDTASVPVRATDGKGMSLAPGAGPDAEPKIQ